MDEKTRQNSSLKENKIHPFEVGDPVASNQVDQLESNLNDTLEIEAKDTEHMQLAEQVVVMLDFVGSIIGSRFIYDWKILKEFMFWFTTVLLSSVWVSQAYTQLVHFRNHDYVRIMEPLAMYGYTLSVTMKLYTYCTRYRDFIALVYTFRVLCRANKFGTRADILKQDLLRITQLIKIFFVGTYFCCFAYATPSVLLFVFKHEQLSLLPIKYPYIDDTEVSGFLITSLFHSCIGIFGCASTAFHGCLFITIIANYITRVKLIEQDLKDLDDMWDNNNKISVAYKRAFLVNICKKQQDWIEFMNVERDLVQDMLFVYFSANYFSLIICLFEIKKNDWTPGYGMAMSLFVEMGFYCILGTQITIANDKFCSIICERNWYTYDLRSQKMLISLLHNAQMAQEIQLGPIGPLNMVTGISILKSIYSYYTVMQELF